MATYDRPGSQYPSHRSASFFLLLAKSIQCLSINLCCIPCKLKPDLTENAQVGSYTTLKVIEDCMELRVRGVRNVYNSMRLLITDIHLTDDEVQTPRVWAHPCTVLILQAPLLLQRMQ